MEIQELKKIVGDLIKTNENQNISIKMQKIDINELKNFSSLYPKSKLLMKKYLSTNSINHSNSFSTKSD